MSTRTLALNRSMPNQWAQFQLECFNEDQLSMSIWTQALNRSMQKLMGTISACMFQRRPAINVNTKLLINRCQTNGHNLSLYFSMRSSYHCPDGHKLLINRCQTNGHNLSSYVSTRTSCQCQYGHKLLNDG